MNTGISIDKQLPTSKYKLVLQVAPDEKERVYFDSLEYFQAWRKAHPEYLAAEECLTDLQGNRALGNEVTAWPKPNAKTEEEAIQIVQKAHNPNP